MNKYTPFAIAILFCLVYSQLTKQKQSEPLNLKLKPVVVLSHFYNKELMYRASITNDTIITLGTNASHELKFDFIYGNRDGIKELDGNNRR